MHQLINISSEGSNRPRGTGQSSSSIELQRFALKLSGAVWREALSLLLGGVCRAPKRARIDAIWIEFEHGVIELARSGRRVVQAIEIADVLPRLPNDAGIIFVFGHFVPGDHRSRL